MGFVSAYDSMKPRQPQGSGADPIERRLVWQKKARDLLAALIRVAPQMAPLSESEVQARVKEWVEDESEASVLREIASATERLDSGLRAPLQDFAGASQGDKAWTAFRYIQQAVVNLHGYHLAMLARGKPLESTPELHALTAQAAVQLGALAQFMVSNAVVDAAAAERQRTGIAKVVQDAKDLYADIAQWAHEFGVDLGEKLSAFFATFLKVLGTVALGGAGLLLALLVAAAFAKRA